VKIWHPDRFSADDERFRRKAEAKLKEINEAYAYINSHTGADSPASDAHFVDVNDATQYITAITRNVNGEVQDLVRRFKAGEFAERADALEAFGRMVARMEAVSANVNDVVERVKRDVPNAAANATFIQSQQNMNQVAEAIRQMKELLECQ
jgi:curved DNA-binding protein CbpA